jgi:hypothetical protein
VTQKVHHNTKKAADMALAKRLISRSSHEAILAGTLSLDWAKELGREGGAGGRTSRGGSRAATERLPEGRERPQEGVGAPRPCLCGCGESVRGKKSRFRPGHDMRLYGELKRNLEKDPLLRNERFTDEQKAYAKERGLI